VPDFSRFPDLLLNRFLPFFCLSFVFFWRALPFFVTNKKKNGEIPVYVRSALVSQWKKNGKVVGRICECSYIHPCNFALRTQLNIPLANPTQRTRLLPAPPTKRLLRTNGRGNGSAEMFSG